MDLFYTRKYYKASQGIVVMCLVMSAAMMLVAALFAGL